MHFDNILYRGIMYNMRPVKYVVLFVNNNKNADNDDNNA